MKVGLDLDGCVVDWDGGVIRADWIWFADGELPRSQKWLDPLERTQHRSQRGFSTMSDLYGWLDTVPNFWANLDPIPGAFGGIADLQAAGHEVVVVTHRPPSAWRQTYEWLFRWHLRLPVQFLAEKELAGCDVYIDDAPHILERLDELGIPAIRFSQPWNAGCPGIEARSWLDVPGLVNYLSDNLAKEAA